MNELRVQPSPQELKDLGFTKGKIEYLFNDTDFTICRNCLNTKYEIRMTVKTAWHSPIPNEDCFYTFRIYE